MPLNMRYGSLAGTTFAPTASVEIVDDFKIAPRSATPQGQASREDNTSHKGMPDDEDEESTKELKAEQKVRTVVINPVELVAWRYTPPQFKYRRRRVRDSTLKYSAQQDRGRPGPSWKRCNMPGCKKFGCLFEDRGYICDPLPLGEETAVISQRMKNFFRLLIEARLPNLSLEAKIVKFRVLEAFVCSPPVEVSFCEFVEWCRVKEIRPEPEELATELTAVRHDVIAFMRGMRLGSIDDKMHDYVCRNDSIQQTPKDLSLKHMARRYCFMLESWRHHMARRGADWVFGTDEDTADLIEATLLNGWVLSDFGQSRVTFVSRHLLNDLWTTWLDRYHPLMAVDDMIWSLKTDENWSWTGEKGGIYCGFGEGRIPWMSKRMSQALRDSHSPSSEEADRSPTEGDK